MTENDQLSEAQGAFSLDPAVRRHMDMIPRIVSQQQARPWPAGIEWGSVYGAPLAPAEVTSGFSEYDPRWFDSANSVPWKEPAPLADLEVRLTSSKRRIGPL